MHCLQRADIIINQPLFLLSRAECRWRLMIKERQSDKSWMSVDFVELVYCTSSDQYKQN